MVKRGRHKRGGRITPKGTRPPGVTSGSRRAGPNPEPDLLDDLRRAVGAEHPFELLALASTLLAVTDPRSRNPFERRATSRPEGPSREELVASFLGVELVETSALLAVIGEMAGDEVLRARIRRELAGRPHVLPQWLGHLGETEVFSAVEMVHVLGDGDNVMLGVHLPEGHELTAMIYIDHNLGTVVKDAFVAVEPLAQLLERMKAQVDDPDTAWHDLSPADARARIGDAIATGAITIPPYETDTWPACRPLVEWITNLLPEGGTGYQRPEWDSDELAELAGRFFASPFATGLDDADRRGLLDSVLWFASGYGPGDPLRWSPPAVEILLEDWIPRKIVADVAYLSLAPDLLRAFIRFCHHERGIRPDLTSQTLAAVDEHEPSYQRSIRSPRLQGPEALLAAMGALDVEDSPALITGGGPIDFAALGLDFSTSALNALRRSVGGDEALQHLDVEPLPDEGFSWAGIPADVQERVAEVLEECDLCCDELLGVEYRTASRRLLARVASGDAEVFRRKGRSDTAAAAVCWAIGKTNNLFSSSGGGMLVKDLMAHFGLHQGSVSQRAATLLRAGGFDTSTYDLSLGSPDFLVSSRRRHIINRRDYWQAKSTGP